MYVFEYTHCGLQYFKVHVNLIAFTSHKCDNLQQYLFFTHFEHWSCFPASIKSVRLHQLSPTPMLWVGTLHWEDKLLMHVTLTLVYKEPTQRSHVLEQDNILLFSLLAIVSLLECLFKNTIRTHCVLHFPKYNMLCLLLFIFN